MALDQVTRGALDAPWPQASWFSVVRRALVVAGFLVFAVRTNTLDSTVFAAFGALQVGLGESVLPLRTLMRQLGAMLIALALVAFFAMTLGGTWWTVPLLALVAFAQGATASVGPIPRSVGIGALAMGVIFAGIEANPLVAVSWLAVGAMTQAAAAVLFWSRERSVAVGIALANLVRTMQRIVDAPRASGQASSAATVEVVATAETIQASGVPNREAALRVTQEVNEVRRNVVAWSELEQPGLHERLVVEERLRVCERRLSEGPAPSPPPANREPSAWPIRQQLDANISRLESAIADLGRSDQVPGPIPSTSHWRGWQGLRPGSADFSNGLRMALAIAVAQALSLLLPLNHAFWIPLTCVFIVKPDWAFTLIRSVARIGGNLGAVLLVPAVVFVAGDSNLGSALGVFVISAIAFRYFTGNYIVGSFGIAGTVLILDYLLTRDPDLYSARVIGTLIGAVVGVLAVAAVPAWRSRQAVELLEETLSGLAAWSDRVVAAVQDPQSVDAGEIARLAEQERSNLVRLRPAVAAAILEPRPVADPRCLAVLVDAIDRAHVCLVTLTYAARLRHESGGTGVDVSEAALAVQACLGSAIAALGRASDEFPPAPTARALAPATAQDIAVAVEVVRLEQAAADIAAAVPLVTRRT